MSYSAAVSITAQPVSFTTNYSFAKPGVGDSANVWGDLLNADLDQIDALLAALQSGLPQKQTRYYLATSGQTAFPLTTPDLFGKLYSLNSTSDLAVYRNGQRLIPDPGGGVGGYTVNVAASTVVLTWPAGDGEQLAIDIYQVLGSSAAASTLVDDEALTITTTNVFPALQRTPDNVVFTLFVDGRPFFPIGPAAAFTISGNMITWTSTTYSVPPGAEVIAQYSAATISPTPPGWWTTLPTTLPPVPGVVWNNGGVICVS